MFLRPTVILVGAGASAEFGLPTGDKIYAEAAKEDPSNINRSGDNWAQFFCTFWDFISYANDQVSKREFKQLVEHLQINPSYSIDLYAYNNPSLSRIAKFYTVWLLLKHHFREKNRPASYDQDDWRYAERHYPWRSPYLGGNSRRPNWLGLLCNQFLSGAKDVKDLEANQLLFVTLNYDRAIEESFANFVRSNERFKDTPDEFMPEVIHVHGSLDDVANESINLKFYQKQIENIQFILDSLATPLIDARAAIDALSEYDAIYSVGFAFEENNCNLLRVADWGHKAAALNFSGDVKSKMMMSKMGLPESRIWSGSPSSPKYLGIAAQEGFFSL